MAELKVKIDNGIIQKSNQDKNGNDITETYLERDTSLNLNSWETGQITRILEGEDLNDPKFLKPGVYCSISTANTREILNVPQNTGNFRLITMQNTGLADQSTFWGQQWFLGNAGTVYYRGADTQIGYYPWKNIGDSAIVAKSLGTNGYVKYASGLIIQWGQVKLSFSNSTQCPMFTSAYYITTNTNINMPTSVFATASWKTREDGASNQSPLAWAYISDGNTLTITSTKRQDTQWLAWVAIGY